MGVHFFSNYNSKLRDFIKDNTVNQSNFFKNYIIPLTPEDEFPMSWATWSAYVNGKRDIGSYRMKHIRRAFSMMMEREVNIEELFDFK